MTGKHNENPSSLSLLEGVGVGYFRITFDAF
jgi:hypothetical protein